jgi:hypothetical protein
MIIFQKKIICLSVFIILSTFGLLRAHAALINIQVSLSNFTMYGMSDYQFEFETTTALVAETVVIIQDTSNNINFDNFTINDIDIEVDGLDGEVDLVENGDAWIVEHADSANGNYLSFIVPSYIDANTLVTIKLGANATYQAAGESFIQNPIAGLFPVEILVDVDTYVAEIAILQQSTYRYQVTIESPYLTLETSLSDISLGELSQFSTNVNSVQNIIVSTNASSGYVLFAETAGLTNTNAAYTIAAYNNEPSVQGSDGWGYNVELNTVPNSGSLPVAAGGVDVNPFLDSNFFTGTSSILASSLGISIGHSYYLTLVANISPIAPAGVYTGEIEFKLVGNF